MQTIPRGGRHHKGWQPLLKPQFLFLFFKKKIKFLNNILKMMWH